MQKKYMFLLTFIISLMAVLGIGLSYSMWIMTNKQDNVNAIETTNKCFNVELKSESDNIKLENAYPISDDAGSKLSPYSFKITNTCEWNAYYKVNLETLNKSTINNKFIKASINNSNAQVINMYKESDTSLKDGKIANTLKSGYLPVGGSVSFNLRLWMDYETTIDDIKNDGTDKWIGKIVVASNLVEDEEILSACKSHDGDLIDDGECRKYYVKINNIVNMEKLAFGNEGDGCTLNRKYNESEKSWQLSYCGSNKWFGWLFPFDDNYKHIFFGKYNLNYSSDNITIEIRSHKSDNDNITYNYCSIKVDDLQQDNYSLYFHLSKCFNKAENLVYEPFLLYRQFPALSINETSIDYYLKEFEILDLTLMFGEGNEPDKEWCNKYLTNYFEYNTEGTMTPIKEIGEPVKTSYYDKIDMFD